MNEWAFAGEIKSWWDAEFSKHPTWGMSRCELEKQPEERGYRRSDLSIIGGGAVKLAGELRLPDHPMSSPWHPDNLNNAISKATTMGARWAFTSDGTTILVIDTALAGPAMTRVVQRVDLKPFQLRDQLNSDTFLASMREAWLRGLRQIAPIVAGQVEPAGTAPDEVFIESLRALLQLPVGGIRDALDQQRQTDPAFEQALVTWMVEEQGWVHLPDQWPGELLRTAQLTAYVFSTRLLFYEALRGSQPTLSKLGIPSDDPAVVQALFRSYFEQARIKSRDYETIFSFDRTAEFALTSPVALNGWQRVIQHLSAFELGTVGFDIMGKMFERLIDPHERYRWGQHYTQPDVVDLMLSYAIPDGSGAVLDPAVGGGTFLVRAYMRKKALHPQMTHQELLADLYGFDVSAFAANLATVNLAVRRLEFEDNYPRIAIRSFFQVDPGQNVLTLPAPLQASLTGNETQAIVLDSVRAVVSNPPYVRLQELGRARRDEAERVLGSKFGRVPTPSRLPGSPNYHVYFWFHGAQFVEADGRLVLITSGEWMDSDYGAVLQKWLLDNFLIEACIESIAEPWFTEARVGTVVVSAKQCSDETVRAANRVPFVLVRKPLSEIFGATDSELARVASVDRFRDQLNALTAEFGESDDYDWSTVTQADLLSLGAKLGATGYVGRPWRSRFIRAPKMAHEVAGLPKMVPLEELAEVRLGLKTGHDKFFFVKEAGKAIPSTEQLVPAKGRQVRVKGVEGWEGDVARKDLLPAALNPHQLGAADKRQFSIPANGKDYYLYPRDKAPEGDLAGYVALGVQAGVPQGQLVKANATGARWYRQSRGVIRSRWALPYNSGYSYGAWDNKAGAVLNGRFVGVQPNDGADEDLLGAALNSTFAAATRLLEGTATGVEGAFDVGPPAARRMMVPDVRLIGDSHAERIKKVMSEWRDRDLMPAAPDRDASVDELRHRLDRALLEGLGYSPGEASTIVSRLYESYARWRKAVEQVESAMRVNRSQMARRGQGRGVSPTESAAQRIWEEMASSHRRYPADFLQSEDELEEVNIDPKASFPTQDSMFDPGVVTDPSSKVHDLLTYDRVRFARMLLDIGFRSPLAVPTSSEKCAAIADSFDREQEKLRRDAKRRAASYVGRGHEGVQTAVERLWARASRAAGMGPTEREE